MFHALDTTFSYFRISFCSIILQLLFEHNFAPENRFECFIIICDTGKVAKREEEEEKLFHLVNERSLTTLCSLILLLFSYLSFDIKPSRVHLEMPF